jgi:PEP-CTERM motif
MEPATIALFGMGLLPLVIRRRKTASPTTFAAMAA